MQKYNLEFLREFTKELIINSLPENYKEKKTEGFFLGKITPLILDPRVIAIECTGPGRFVIVKLPDKKLSTNITLTKENIDGIINTFSEESRIPRIGGVFKAVVNNMVVTAIDSHIGGPRFIINKIRQQQYN